jgi:hypothetical protein
MRVADLMPDAPELVEGLLASEIAGFDTSSPIAARILADFTASRIPPEPVEVQFSGGIFQDCWAVTRADARYRVIWLPMAGYFALCVEGQFGPLDIGVHGPALSCFASV